MAGEQGEPSGGHGPVLGRYRPGASASTIGRGIILDMDGPERPTYGQQEASAWNGHFGRTCYRPLFDCNEFGDLERARLLSRGWLK